MELYRVMPSIAALEKNICDNEVCDEIETANPGYLGSQVTFSAGSLKGCDEFINKSLWVGIEELLFASSIRLNSYHSGRYTQ